MALEWDETVDVLVVGSGGGGMTAAIMAEDKGAKALIIEKCASFGGSTAMSGGSIWIPNNHLMAKAQISDSFEEGLAYLRTITSGKVRDELLRAYVESAPELVEYLEKNCATRFAITPDYPDYYPTAEGAKSEGGRSLEPVYFKRRTLGELAKDLRMPSPHCIPMGRWMVTASEASQMMNTSLFARLDLIRRFLQYLLNPVRSFARTDTRLSLGNALAASLRHAVAMRNIPLWLNTSAKHLITEGDRVVGLEVQRNDKQIRIRARKGVILAAGGFDKNSAMREKHHVSGECASWSSGNPDNLGDAIGLGQEVGASIGNMEEAWWMPTAMVPGHLLPWSIKGSWWTEFASQKGVDFPWFILPDRSTPGSIIVDQTGRRFTNEAAPYLDVGHAQITRHCEGGKAIPAVLIGDQRHRWRYPFGPIMPGMPTKKFIESGFLKKANTLEELAGQCGIDPEGLVHEIEHFNKNARRGVDPDFHRGELSIDRFYGDPNVKPNPCLSPVDKPPFYGINIYPGDLGTKGGLRFDTEARVLRADDTPIEGLYATGNCTASIMGDSYPGAGGTIGPAMTFGYRAARHAANRKA